MRHLWKFKLFIYLFPKLLRHWYSNSPLLWYQFLHLIVCVAEPYYTDANKDKFISALEAGVQDEETGKCGCLRKVKSSEYQGLVLTLRKRG